LIELETEVLFLIPGAYKNFDDLENSLTQEELIKLYEKAMDVRYEDKKFFAAIQGVDLEEGKKTDGDMVIERAKAKAMGMSEEQYEFDGMFDVVYEDED
jgi:hypothetical protein